MNNRLYPLAFGMSIAAGMAILVAGCNQQVASAPNSAKPVATSVGTEIDDTVVTAKVKSALLGDQDIKGFEFKVETRKGMVQLSGFVDNLAMAERAINITRSIEGVKGVENGMSIKNDKVSVGNKVDDGIVTAKVKSALLSDPGVKSADIAVTTRKGEVQLSGFVDNRGQIDRAIDVARTVEGVRTVVSEMSVKK